MRTPRPYEISDLEMVDSSSIRVHQHGANDKRGLQNASARDLNPIEQLFAKLKHVVRRDQPRTVAATWRKVGDLLDLFSPPNARTASGTQDMLLSERSMCAASV